MEKQKLVEKLLDEGILISPDALDESTDAEETLKAAKSQDKLVFDFRQKPQADKPVKVSVSAPKRLSEVQAEDVVKYYSVKYDAIKDLLKDKTDAVSIVNAKKAFSGASIIGIVKEHTQKGFIAEDQTGEIEVVSRDRPEVGDVVGVKGFTREGRIFSSTIMHPDIPLNRKIGHTDVTIDLGKETEYYIEAGGEKRSLKSPCYITITKTNESKILFYLPTHPITINDAKTFLLKRHLSPQKTELLFRGDPFLIDPIPEILWVPSEENKTEVYKGVLIVCKEAAKVDLSTLQIIP